MTWWHEDYLYRRTLLVEAPAGEGVPASHPLTAIVSHVLIDNGKVRSDFEDVEVVYMDGDGKAHLLYREVEEVFAPEDSDLEDVLEVRFQLQNELEPADVLTDRYYLYYGNLELTNRPDRPGFVFIDGGTPEVTGEDGELDGGEPDTEFVEGDEVEGGDPWVSVELKDVWPIRIQHDDNLITYTRPGEHWKGGVSTRPLARATIQIYCTKFRILSEVGPDRGIMEVQINDGEWDEVDLYSPDPEIRPVFEVWNMDPLKLHEVRVRVAESTNTLSVGLNVNIVAVEYSKPVILSDVGEQVSDLIWSSFVGGV